MSSIKRPWCASNGKYLASRTQTYGGNVWMIDKLRGPECLKRRIANEPTL
jgi:hypothetical protein